mmetsp:Transcript_70450/g.120948  ORF Transcript_70450/g.120948 Transcript_70450/m.120948 type:complete len:135 (+) Transcript_70450:1-405(+)
MGMLHSAGGVGVEKDLEKAFKWFMLAAEAGNAMAQCHLGNMYYNGTGVAKDHVVARILYERSAKQMNVIGKFKLGKMVANGEGKPARRKSSKHKRSSIKMRLQRQAERQREALAALARQKKDDYPENDTDESTL